MRLFALIAFLWSFVCFSRCVNVCRDECNDGGCAYTDESGTYKGCDCHPTNRTGSECESFVDACGSETFKPCKNGGKCVSSLGSAYCDCPTGYHGSKCSDLHGGELQLVYQIVPQCTCGDVLLAIYLYHKLNRDVRELCLLLCPYL